VSLSREQEFGYKTQELAAWEIFPVAQCTYLFLVPRNPLALAKSLAYLRLYVLRTDVGDRGALI
jgi:hypothetical protein